MKRTGHFFLVVAMVCTLVSGCASRRTASKAPLAWQNSDIYPELPADSFDGYEAAFRYIARCEHLPEDRHTTFALAAESTIERARFDLTGDLAVVRAEYYRKSESGIEFGIRGAQGQGRYYAFQIRDGRWKLVGIFHGNSYRWSAVGKNLHVITAWHMSANESPETIYTWNGRLFE